MKPKEFKLGMRKVPISQGEIYRAGLNSKDPKFVMDRAFDIINYLKAGDLTNASKQHFELMERYHKLKAKERNRIALN
jgi:hypothetical protein